MAAEWRNRTSDEGFQVLAFANLPREFCRDARLGRAFHLPQRLPRPHFRKNIEEARLFQLRRQTLLERSVKNVVAGLVIEVSQQHRVFAGRWDSAMKVKPCGSGAAHQHCSQRNQRGAATFVRSATFRQKRAG